MNNLKKLIESAKAHPFLFIGSGFSRRYLNAKDWKGLITHFANLAKPDNSFAFEWFKNEVEANGYNTNSLPHVTELVQSYYNRRFFTEEPFRELREKYVDELKRGVSPLKIGVADHFISEESAFSNPNHHDEIEALGHARKNIAGLITTNFDSFLENLFPDHIPYIGQNELLFNPSYGVGEIYKIHGCVSNPDSLILTATDYAEYEKRNAYLSAKLMTLFLEHPIIFIGYSITDTNIRSIFKNIANCLNGDQLATLSSRLIFIQRANKNRAKGISNVRETFDSKSIEFTQITLDDFPFSIKR